MKKKQDFHSADKVSDETMAEQTWLYTEQCQACNGTGQTPRRFESEIIICESCSGKGEIEIRMVALNSYRLHNIRDWLIAWERFKEVNWWASDESDIKVLMDEFEAIHGNPK